MHEVQFEGQVPYLLGYGILVVTSISIALHKHLHYYSKQKVWRQV